MPVMYGNGIGLSTELIIFIRSVVSLFEKEPVAPAVLFLLEYPA